MLAILSIDLGVTCGVAVMIDGELEFTEEYEYKKGLLQLQTYVKQLIMLWQPDLILIPYPTRHYNVIMSHGKMIGVIEAVAEYKDILTIEVQDNTCKKVVLGKGNARKEDIALFYKDQYPEIESEHILDAIMFCDYYLIATNKKKPNKKCQKKITQKGLNIKKASPI